MASVRPNRHDISTAAFCHAMATRHGCVTHMNHEGSGLISFGFITFIGHNFDLGTLGTRDAGTDAFGDCFDYTQQPSAFAPIPTRVSAERLVLEKNSGPPDDD